MTTPLYGTLGQFATPEALLQAIRQLRQESPALRLEAYTPYAVEGLSEALGLKRNIVPLATLVGGVVGGVGGFLMQWYAAVVSYPVNIGGRPLNSWPMFVPATFELAILGAALAAVASMLLANGLPRLYHPIFNAAHFNLATRNQYFLCIRADPAQADDAACREKLMALGAHSVMEVHE